MYRPSINTPLSPTIAVAITLAGVLIAPTSVSADYQQTLAARGADAFEQAPITIDIDNEALAETFATNIIEANPALSDQEVMIDLQARMLAEQRLTQAAANLEPATADSQDADSATKLEGEPVASR